MMMKSKPFTRRLRQFRFFVKQLNQQIQSGVFEQFSRAKKQALLHKLNSLLKQLQQVVPNKQIRKTLAKATFVLALGAATNLQAQSFATPVKNPFGLQSSNDFFIPTFVDIDKDGDLDLYVSGYPANSEDLSLYFVENIGSATTPQFTASHVPNAFGFESFEDMISADFADIDNDGDIDMFVGREGSAYAADIEFFENIGTATAPEFASKITNPFGLVSTQNYSIPQFIDVDADGDMDLFVSEDYGQLQFFENIGTSESALFTAPLQNPFGISPQENINGEFTFHDFADVDNDGDMDLLYFGVLEEYNSAIFYQENTGTAQQAAFASPQTNPFGIVSDASIYLQALAFADLDADGDQDILTSIYGDSESFYHYYQNTTISAVSDIVQTVQLQLSPNPVQNTLLLQTNLPQINQTFDLQLMDEMGRVLLQETASVFSKQWRYQRDISDLASGIYFIKIENATLKGSIQFIKE